MPCQVPQNKKYFVNPITVYLKTVGIAGWPALQMLLLWQVMGFFKADIKSLFLIRAVFKKISFQLTKKVTN